MGADARPLRRRLAGHDGVGLSALEWPVPDPPAPDPPVLLHHGLASSAGFWGPTASRLASGSATCRRVLAIDARGHGESDRPDERYDFESVTRDLDRALADLGWRDPGMPLLVGHSWGAHVVLEYAARHPGIPAGLVLVDGGAMAMHLHLSWEQTEQELAPPRLDPMTWEEFAARAATWWRATGWSPEVEAAIRHNFEELPDGTIRVRLSRERHMRILRAMWEEQVPPLYELIACPVLLLAARRSDADLRERRFIEGKERGIAEAEATLRRRGVRAEVEWFEESIHDIPLQHPGRLAERIEAFAQTIGG